MSVIRRPAADRGHVNIGWLNSKHSFSFGHYYDPKHMGYRSLRVINEDRVRPGEGFGQHGHRDMEIISYVLEGGLAHKDSMGNGSIIKPGEVQRMSAGRGVFHSEYNASSSEEVHFLQIWILPEAQGLSPSYEQNAFPEEERRGRLRLIASRDGREGSVTIHQDVSIYAGLFSQGEEARHPLAPGRHAWVHIARGEAKINGQPLKAGDALALSEEAAVEIAGTKQAEVLVFDLA